MPMDDLQFESFLLQFELVRPDPIPSPQTQAQRWWRPLFAAAAAVVTAAVIWHTSRTTWHHEAAELQVVRRVSPTLGPMQRLTDSQELDSILDTQSHRLLPDVENSHGALALLAKP